MNKRFVIKTIVLTCMVLIVNACNKDYVEFKDMQNRKVKIPKQIERVVCLSPGVSELFYEFNIQDKLVGRSSFAYLPKEIQSKPVCGEIYRLDTTAILQAQPDLVISSEVIPWNERRFLARNDIPLFIFKSNKVFTDIYPAIEIFGKIFDKNKQAKDLIEKLQKKEKQLNQSSKKNKKKVYYVVGYGNKINLTVNGSQLIGDIIKKAGLVNIAENDADMKYELSDLQSQDPYYIIVSTKDYEDFIKRPPYMFLSAVRNDRVIPIDNHLLNSLSVSNLTALEQIIKATD